MRFEARTIVIMLAAGLGVGAAAGCAQSEPGSGSGPNDGGSEPAAVHEAEPLAKIEGWRSDAARDEMPFGVVEVADDVETAQQAWQDNVPEDIGEGDSDVGEPGMYGSLDDIDFEAQVLIVWHSGESGSCPAWLAGIDTVNGSVIIERGEHSPGDACTDDYNPYRMVLAVDRDQLPEVDQLPTEDVSIDDSIIDGRVVAYPDEALDG